MVTALATQGLKNYGTALAHGYTAILALEAVSRVGTRILNSTGFSNTRFLTSLQSKVPFSAQTTFRPYLASLLTNKQLAARLGIASVVSVVAYTLANNKDNQPVHRFWLDTILSVFSSESTRGYNLGTANRGQETTKVERGSGTNFEAFPSFPHPINSGANFPESQQ
jgi:hypothetical protein